MDKLGREGGRDSAALLFLRCEMCCAMHDTETHTSYSAVRVIRLTPSSVKHLYALENP